jgi:hypothetical protein
LAAGAVDKKMAFMTTHKQLVVQRQMNRREAEQMATGSSASHVPIVEQLLCCRDRHFAAGIGMYRNVPRRRQGSSAGVYFHGTEILEWNSNQESKNGTPSK